MGSNERITSGEDRGARDRFQMVIRLQRLRVQAHEGLRRCESWQPGSPEIEQILVAIQHVALDARAEGLNGFTSVCLHVCERIEPFLRSGGMPRSILGLIAEWSARSELYLRRPHYLEFAKALTLQLSDARWGWPLDRAAQDHLLRAML